MFQLLSLSGLFKPFFFFFFFFFILLKDCQGFIVGMDDPNKNSPSPKCCFNYLRTSSSITKESEESSNNKAHNLATLLSNSVKFIIFISKSPMATLISRFQILYFVKIFSALAVPTGVENIIVIAYLSI